MHDCRQTQDSLIDLIFDEQNGAARARLVAEIERCAPCAAEYRSFAATLDACDEASDALTPGENYWPQYHAALTRRLHGAAGDTQATGLANARPMPFWKRLLTSSIRVPVPFAATAALLLLAACGIALLLAARAAPEPVLVAAPHAEQTETPPQIKFIEVPVVQEKIVTQIIYRPRGGDRQVEVRQSSARENLAGAGRRNAPAASPATNTAANTTAASSRANLSGFKPAGEVNLRIIKGSNAREQ